jgi:cholest-4-en-3-one 26-monooxygenase
MALDLFDRSRFTAGPPHDLFRTLREESPVAFFPEPDGPGFWGVFRYADVVEVSRHPQRFASAPAVFIQDPKDPVVTGELLINQDPPRHTKLRKLVNRGFTPRQIAALEPHVRAMVVGLLDRAAAMGEFDLVHDLAVELPLQVIAELVGVPHDERHQVFEWTERMMSNDTDDTAAFEQDSQAALAEMFAYADQLAASRTTGDGTDLLSVLLRADVEGEALTQFEVDVFFMLLMNAGSETTRNLITGGTLALFEHPDQRARLAADPGLIPTAVEEMLRWVTPVMHFRRTAQVDLEIAGQPIAAGEKVVMWYTSANRDDAQFPAADTFDVGRTPNDHVAFGAGGPHFCLGASPGSRPLRRPVHPSTCGRTSSTASSPCRSGSDRRPRVVSGPVVVTGAAVPGLRAGLAAGLAAAGVTVVDLPVAALDDRGAVDAALAVVLRDHGRVGGVVHVALEPDAGVRMPITEVDDGGFDAVWERTLGRTLTVLGAAYAVLRPTGGAIVVVGSMVGLAGAAGLAPYAAAAEGVRVLAKSAARQWGPDGVRVNVVVPAPEHEPTGVRSPELALSPPALGGPGDPALDLAPVVAWLLGESAHIVTGVTVPADGGVWMAG